MFPPFLPSPSVLSSLPSPQLEACPFSYHLYPAVPLSRSPFPTPWSHFCFLGFCDFSFLLVIYLHLKLWSQEPQVRKNLQSFFLSMWVPSIKFIECVFQFMLNERNIFICLLPYDRYYLKAHYIDEKMRANEVYLFAQRKMAEF